MYNNKCSRYQIEVTRPKQPKWGFSSAGRAPALHAGGQEFESPNLHHLIQVELLKSEPSGSFLMLSASISFEEIIADLNSANPTSAISCFASFTNFSIVAKGSRNITVTFLYLFYCYLILISALQLPLLAY